MNPTNFKSFGLSDEDYTFLGKTFKVPKARAQNGGNIDMFTNGAWKNSGKNVEEVPSISLEEYELSFGLWMTHLSRLYNTVSSFAAEITTPYQLLYQGNYTGFTYTLPYLINQGTIKGQVQNTWGGEEAGIGKSFAGSFGAKLDQSLSNIGKFFAEGSSYGGAGEKVNRYSSQDNVKSITIKFPLYNTIDKDKTLRNFEFVTLFTLQNLKTRTSWMTYLPPKIYKVNSNSFGGINMPAAFVQTFDATAVGTVRKIRYKGFLDKDILIPEAYEVTITMTELLPESSNTFAATMGGDPVTVIGNTTNTPRVSVNYDQSITPTGLAPIPSADLAYLKKQKEIAEANLNNLQNQTASGATGVVGDNPNAITVNVGNVPSRENLDQAIKAQQETIKFIQTQIDQALPTTGIQTAGGKVFAFGDLPSGATEGPLTNSSSKSLDIGTRQQSQDTGQQSQDTFLDNPKAVAGRLELPQSFLTSALKLSIIAPAAPAIQLGEETVISGVNTYGGGIVIPEDNKDVKNTSSGITPYGGGIVIPVQNQLASLAASRADEISNSLNQPVKIETLTIGVAPSFQPGMGIKTDLFKSETTFNETLKKQLESFSPPTHIGNTQYDLKEERFDNKSPNFSNYEKLEPSGSVKILIPSKAPDSVKILDEVQTIIPSLPQTLNRLTTEEKIEIISYNRESDAVKFKENLDKTSEINKQVDTTLRPVANDTPK